MADGSAPIAAFAFKTPPVDDALEAMLKRAERVGIPRERVLLALGEKQSIEHLSSPDRNRKREIDADRRVSPALGRWHGELPASLRTPDPPS